MKAKGIVNFFQTVSSKLKKKAEKANIEFTKGLLDFQL